MGIQCRSSRTPTRCAYTSISRARNSAPSATSIALVIFVPSFLRFFLKNQRGHYTTWSSHAASRPKSAYDSTAPLYNFIFAHHAVHKTQPMCLHAVFLCLRRGAAATTLTTNDVPATARASQKPGDERSATATPTAEDVNAIHSSNVDGRCFDCILLPTSVSAVAGWLAPSQRAGYRRAPSHTSLDKEL